MGIYQSTHSGVWHDNQLSASEVFDLIYPIGSIYMSINNTNPSSLFGGTWVQIEDTFLLAAGTTYTGGTTGGEATHTLTTSETPAHTHTRGTMNITGGFAPWGDTSTINVTAPEGAFYISAASEFGWGTSTGRDQDNAYMYFDASRNWTGETSSVGGGPLTTICRLILQYIYGKEQLNKNERR